MFGPKYNPKNTMTYNVPDRTPSGEIVNKIFSKIASGNFFDIKNAIIQERSSLGGLHDDAMNRTILHHILINNEISKNDKYDLITQCINMGAAVDLPDTTGVRPLHIASGQQNGKVVSLLLTKKADANSKDNNHFTPLHYAVFPDIAPCISPLKKVLIPDTELITSEFRTDDLFNKLFDNFKSDPTVQMYISHIASIFKNRHIYPEQDEDRKVWEKLAANTMNERTNISISESISAKMIDYKKAIYTKTKTYFGKTFSKLVIAENAVNGWAPAYNGTKHSQYAILPFSNLRNEFDEIYKSFTKASESTIGKLLAQVEKVNARVEEMLGYVTNTNDIMNTLFDCHRMLQLYNTQLTVHFPNTPKLLTALDALGRGCSALATVFADNFNAPTFQNRVYATHNFANPKTSHFTNILHQFAGDFRHRTGIGNILMMYANSIKDMQTRIKNYFTDITQNLTQHLLLNAQSDIVKILGDAQIKLVNICYTLLHFDSYAKQLSRIIEQFKTALVKEDMTIILTYVSDFINDVVENHNLNQNASQLQLTRWDNNNITMKYDVTVVYTHKDNLVAYSYSYNNNPLQINIMSPGDSTIGVDAGPGIYVSSPPLYNWYIYIPNIDFNVLDVNKCAVADIVNKLDKIIEAMGSGQGGKMSDSHSVSNVYSSLYELQDNINAMINIHNMMNGFIYSKTFNNNFVDNSYHNNSTDPFAAVLLSRMEKLKRIPDKYIHFYDHINPMLREGGHYTVENGLAVVKYLINTYGYTISSSPTDNLYCIRSSTQPLPPNKIIGDNPQIPGIISISFDTNAQILKDPVPIKQGYGRVYVGDNMVYFKSADLPQDISIVSTIFDSHIYLLKLIMIMYTVQKMATLYGNNPPLNSDRALIGSMKNIYDQIANMNNNPLGVLFAIIGKMTDEIIISTIDSMSDSSAANYINFLAQGQGHVIPIPASTDLGITKPDDKVRLRDQDMLSSVITSGASQMNGVDMLKIFNRVSDTDTSDAHTDFNRLIDFDSVEKNTDMCYQIDEDIIGYLLDAGADPNISERSGETPLSLGVFLQNEKIVDTLLRSKAKVIFKSGSDSGSRTKNIYNTCYDQLLNSIRASPVMNIDEIEKRVQNHLIKKSGIATTFSNSKLILKMVGYMFVHQITSTANGYPNMWTRDNHNKILTILNLNSGGQDLIPLATMAPKIIAETVSGYATFRDTLDTLTNQLTNAREIFLRLDNSKQNLEL
jgi:ankyrin repeat protein